MIRGRLVRVPLTLLLFVAAAAWMIHWDGKFRVTKTELDERTYPLTAQWVKEHLPPEALLVAYQVSGSLLYYTDRAFISPNNLTSEDNARLNTWIARQDRPLYAALYPYEEAHILQRMPGRWEVVTRVRQVTIWRRLAPGQTSDSTR